MYYESSAVVADDLEGRLKVISVTGSSETLLTGNEREGLVEK